MQLYLQELIVTIVGMHLWIQVIMYEAKDCIFSVSVFNNVLCQLQF